MLPLLSVLVTITTVPFVSVPLIDVDGVIGGLPGLVGEGEAGDVSVRLDSTGVEELIELVVPVMGVLGGGGAGEPPVLGPVLDVAVLLSVDPVVSVPPPPLLLLLLLLLLLVVALVEVLGGENGGGTVVDEPPAITL